jgi:hypothetical protein
MTNQPARFIGPIAIRRYPFACLADVQADARLGKERDLRLAPTPISGGMRKALSKEVRAQNSLRSRRSGRHRDGELRKMYGLLRPPAVTADTLCVSTKRMTAIG